MFIQKKTALLAFLLLAILQLQAQNTIGTAKKITREVGKEYTFFALDYKPANTYQWFKDKDKIIGATAETYTIGALKSSDAGEYFCSINQGQNNSLQTAPLTLNVGNCQDAENGRYPCDELLVKFVPNLSQGQQNEVRQMYGAELIDSCQCRDFQLWRLSDTMDVEEKGVAATKDLTVDSAGPNYNTKELAVQPDIYTYPNLQPSKDDPAKPDDLVVAIIDTGVDYLHPELQGKIWINPLEKINKKDDDSNCYFDDYQGFNFLTDDWENMDDNGHGTHIAGIIVKNSKNVKIMNLKVFDKDGGGNLFNPICAIYYAADHQVPVINLSWGYYGKASLPLERAIGYAGKKGATVIASAGNDATSHAANQHYPSGYDLDNLITVAALNEAETDLADFTNFGSRKIDLAAPGENITSLSPGPGREAVKSGSSMSVGFVSSTTINMKHEKRNSTYRGIKHSMLSTVDPVSDLLSTGGKINEKNAINDLKSSAKARATAPELDLQVFLQGAYDPSTGLMRDGLRSSADFPTSQPFNRAPWHYAGSEHVDAATLAVSGDEAVVDWLLIAYQDPISWAVTTRAALLRRNGKVTDTAGEPLEFGDQYHARHLLIMSRNHLALRTKLPVPLDYLPTTVDFTQGNEEYLNPFGVRKYNGKNFLVAGDINQDGKVNNVDLAVGLSRAADPYSPSDVNMDGVVDVKDKNITKKNRPRRSNCPRCSRRF